MNHRFFCVALLGVTVAACAASDQLTGPPLSLAGLQVSTVTGGTWLDGDGYILMVDSTFISIGTTDSVVVPDLRVGVHQVELLGLAPNCAVTGPNPRPVQVRADVTARDRFSVTCATPPGSIKVAVYPVGTGVLPDSFTATLDGAPAIAFGVGDQPVFAPVLAGNHRVVVSASANPCLPAGISTSKIVVVGSRQESVGIPVSCYAAGTGQVEITMQTSAINWGRAMPSGFSLSVDSAPGFPVPANGQVTISLPAGSHRLVVSAPRFCGASFFDTNTKIIQVVSGGTTPVQFRELCIG